MRLRLFYVLSAEELGGGLLRVAALFRSSSDPRRYYHLVLVMDGEGRVVRSSCECPAHALRGTCRHVRAVAEFARRHVLRARGGEA